MKTHRILGLFLIISLCFSSGYLCDDGYEFEQGKPQGQHEGDEHEHDDGDEHQHHEGCDHGHDHDHV